MAYTTSGKRGCRCPHGYRRYSHTGCKCRVCLAGKAAYMRLLRKLRAERKRQHEAANGKNSYKVPDIKHGLAGYKEFGCTCLICRLAKAKEDSGRHERNRWSNSSEKAA